MSRQRFLSRQTVGAVSEPGYERQYRAAGLAERWAGSVEKLSVSTKMSNIPVPGFGFMSAQSRDYIESMFTVSYTHIS